MVIEKVINKLIPMSETMLYMLLSLQDEMHGYGIMQNVEKLTNGRIKLGAGTIYQTLGKLENNGLIECIREENRRKVYLSTDLGTQILDEETKRIREIYRNLEGKL